MTTKKKTAKKTVKEEVKKIETPEVEEMKEEVEEEVEEEVKEVIDNYIEIMRSGDCSRAEKYIIGDELLSKVKKSASADSKRLDKMKLGEFEICVEKNEAVVIVATQIVDKYKGRKRGYINFYLKKVDVSGDIDESGDWKIDCHFAQRKNDGRRG